jgi:hypothetical protein
LGENSAIQFIVDENCTNISDNSAQPIKLKLTYSYSDTTYTGYMPYENRVEIEVDKINNAINKYDVIRAMGHALGFPKENYRLDTFRAGDFPAFNFSENANLCEKIKYPQPVHADKQSFESVYRDYNNQKVITYKEWQRQPYDHKSIMNYCVDTQEYEQSMKAHNMMLTKSDQKRVRQFYGASGESNDLLFYEGDDLFTGLLKHSDEDSEYSYYQYGRKHPDFTNVNISELGLDEENTDYKKFFAIISRNSSKHILFKYEKSDAYVIKQHIPPVFCVTQTKRIIQKSPLALDCGHYEDSTFKLGESMEEEYEYFYYDSLYETEKKAQLLYCSNEKDNNKNFDLDRETAYFVKNTFFDSPKCSQLYKNYIVINNWIAFWKSTLITKEYKDFLMGIEKERKVISTDFFTGYFRLFVKGEGYNGSIYGLDTLNFINGHPFEYQNLTDDQNGIFMKIDEEDTTNEKPYGHPDNKVTKDKKPIFGTIYPNTFYIDGVQTDDYCYFEKTIEYKTHIPIKQKIYYVFYEEGGTKTYPFSNTIYQDLVVLTGPEEQDRAVKIWDNIKSSRGGARCSEEPLNH